MSSRKGKISSACTFASGSLIRFYGFGGWLDDPRLTVGHYKALQAIATFTDSKTGLANPFRETLADRAKVSVGRLSHLTADLVRWGWLEKVGKGGYSRSCEYRLLGQTDEQLAASLGNAPRETRSWGSDASNSAVSQHGTDPSNDAVWQQGSCDVPENNGATPQHSTVLPRDTERCSTAAHASLEQTGENRRDLTDRNIGAFAPDTQSVDQADSFSDSHSQIDSPVDLHEVDWGDEREIDREVDPGFVGAGPDSVAQAEGGDCSGEVLARQGKVAQSVEANPVFDPASGMPDPVPESSIGVISGEGGTSVPSKKKKRGTKAGYPAEFEACWSEYPKRGGGDSKPLAFKAWSARVEDGADPAEMLAGTIRYRRFCEIEGMIGTRFVKQASTFFGPGEWYTNEYEPTEEIDNSAPGKVKRAIAKRDARILREQIENDPLFGGSGGYRATEKPQPKTFGQMREERTQAAIDGFLADSTPPFGFGGGSDDNVIEGECQEVPF